MRRPILSIAGMMAVVSLVAVGLAALRSPTILWASLTFTLLVALLATATLGAIAGRGRSRATWAGVAAFGWAYFATTFGPVPNGNGVTCPPFPTQVLIEYLRSRGEAADKAFGAGVPLWGLIRRDTSPPAEAILNAPTKAEWFYRGPILGKGPPLLPPLLPYVDWLNLRRVGHSLGAIVFGLLGGVLGRLFGRPGRASGERPVPT